MKKIGLFRLSRETKSDSTFEGPTKFDSTIEFTLTTRGILDAGSLKGYLFTLEKLEKNVVINHLTFDNDLQTTQKMKELKTNTIFKQISKNWYIYFYSSHKIE